MSYLSIDEDGAVRLVPITADDGVLPQGPIGRVNGRVVFARDLPATYTPSFERSARWDYWLALTPTHEQVWHSDESTWVWMPGPYGRIRVGHASKQAAAQALVQHHSR